MILTKKKFTGLINCFNKVKETKYKERNGTAKCYYNQG